MLRRMWATSETKMLTPPNSLAAELRELRILFQALKSELFVDRLAACLPVLNIQGPQDNSSAYISQEAFAVRNASKRLCCWMSLNQRGFPDVETMRFSSLQNRFGRTRGLFVTQGGHRIHAACPSGGQKTSQQSNAKQYRHNQRKCKDIERFYLKK